MGGMPGGLGGVGGMMNPQMMAMTNNPAMQQQMQQVELTLFHLHLSSG